MAKDILRVDSLNRYLYVVNNPVNLVDLNGLEIAKIRIKDSSLEMIVDTDKQDSVIEMLNMYTNAYEYDDRFLLWGEKGIKAYNYAEEKIKKFNYSKGMSVASVLTSTGVYYATEDNKDDIKFCVNNEKGDLTYTITAHNFEKNSYQKMLESMYYHDGNHLSAKNAMERMMRDMNAYNDLNSINDTDFKQIGINFSKHVLYGPMSATINDFRNKLNRLPNGLEELMQANIDKIYIGKTADKSLVDNLLKENGYQWYKVTENKSKLHNINLNENQKNNIKLMSLDGYYEAVFDENGNLLTNKTDPTNMGTFNHSGQYENDARRGYLHITLDVEPWIRYGTSFDDPTIWTQRIQYSID